jgi:hypothetical protein
MKPLLIMATQLGKYSMAREYGAFGCSLQILQLLLMPNLKE